MSASSNNFGLRGWGIIGYAFLLMFINGIIHTNGMNILLSMLNHSHGWDVSSMLNFNTIAGIIGVFSSFVTGRLIVKYGAKKISGIYLICGGLAIIWFGRLNTLVAFFLCMIFLWMCSDGYGQLAPTTLVANWFPKRKGLALGWATMGYCVCAIFSVPLILFLTGRFSFSGGFTVFGIFQIIVGILSLLFLHNYPEEIGAYPDNDKEGYLKTKECSYVQKNSEPALSVKGLFKDANMWRISISMGLLWMSTIGIISQLVPRLIELGYEQTTATRFLQLASIFGLFGSYFFGWLDQKIGTRRTCMFYCWWYIVVLLILAFSHSTGLLIFACCFGGFGTGAICNLLPSFVGTVYGPGFATANGIISPIASIVRCLNFNILSLGILINGTYTPSYLLFAAGAIIAFFLVYKVRNQYP